jgi:chorismate synthase
MVEAMVALTLVDALMMQQAQCALFENDAPADTLPNPMGTTAARPDGPKQFAVGAGKPVSQQVDEE